MIRFFNRLYGFEKPYRFDRATAFLLSLTGFVIVSLLGIHDVREHGPLVWDNFTKFYLYLAGLYLAAVLLALKARLSFLLLVFAIAETTASLGVIAYDKFMHVPVVDLRPEPETGHRFAFHALLQGIPKPLYQQDVPFLKHDAQGRREVVGADDFGNADVPFVNVYGGSTTYDVKVINGYTWVDNLQKYFGKKLRFYNYGVQGFSTVEHIIQTAFYARNYDRDPVCGLYYVGWNDIRNLHIPNLDPGYADFHMLGQTRNLDLRNRRPTLSPLLNMIITLVLGRYEVVRAPPAFSPDGRDTDGADPRLEKIFVRNLETIITLNNSRGTKTFFISQILNRAKLHGMGVYGWLPKVRDKDVWSVQERYNGIMKDVALKNGAVYIDVPIDSFSPIDFADEGHFSASGALKFSNFVAPEIERCVGR